MSSLMEDMHAIEESEGTETIKIPKTLQSLKVIQSEVVSINVLTASLIIWFAIFFATMRTADFKLILLSGFGFLLTTVTYFAHKTGYIF